MYSQQLAKELLDLIIKHEMLPFQKKLESMAKGELLILNYLYQHEDGGLPSEISRQVNVSCARITAIASSLEKKRWCCGKSAIKIAEKFTYSLLKPDVII